MSFSSEGARCFNSLNLCVLVLILVKMELSSSKKSFRAAVITPADLVKLEVLKSPAVPFCNSFPTTDNPNLAAKVWVGSGFPRT